MNEQALISRYKSYVKEATAMGIKNANTKSMNWLYRYVTQNNDLGHYYDFILNKDGSRMVDILGRKVAGYTVYVGYSGYYLIINGKRVDWDQNPYIKGDWVINGKPYRLPHSKGYWGDTYED